MYEDMTLPLSHRGVHLPSQHNGYSWKWVTKPFAGKLDFATNICKVEAQLSVEKSLIRII